MTVVPNPQTAFPKLVFKAMDPACRRVHSGIYNYRVLPKPTSFRSNHSL
jgi:hypothetical protein